MKLCFNFALIICYGYNQRFRTASNPKLPSVDMHHNHQSQYRFHKDISISIAIFWHDQFIHMGTSQVCVHKINDMLNGDEVQYGIKKGFSFFQSRIRRILNCNATQTAFPQINEKENGKRLFR